ncbi:MAG: CvpA family protein [Chloroflexi bacterium]|nr:CvpA family protein [Chloroflexota bacterium]
MNWVDVVLIATLAAGGLVGMWTGMVRASFAVIGVIAGFAVTAQFRPGAEAWIAGYLAGDTLAVILSYIVVISATAGVTLLANRIARKLVYGLFMGWADRLGGMTAGLAVGAVLAGVMVIGMAGLSDGRYSLKEGVTGKVLSVTPIDDGDLSGLDAKLTKSNVVSILVGAADIIPNKALDLAPEDWRDTLAILQRRLESIESARR